MKVAVMIVGLKGATGSTLAATCREAGRKPELAEKYLWTHGVEELAALEDIAFGGWDVWDESWAETLARHGVLAPARFERALAEVREYEAVALASDHTVASGEGRCTKLAGRAIIDRLRADVRDMKRASSADVVVLLDLSGPSLLPPPEKWPQTATAMLRALDESQLASAGPYYYAAAILEGAAIIDYTASATLEMPGMVALAEAHGAPIAGRDGSTGQTLLKSVLAETFATRRLPIRGWYSANILGNHDGLVLEDPRYSDIKKHDKTALLEEILGYPVPHLVDIRHYLPAGDDKEAWDAIDFEAFFGARGRMRINWQCSDSLLAAPPLIDLVRLMARARVRGERGLVTEMGAFFKHPLGTSERRYLHLARVLEAYIARTG